MPKFNKWSKFISRKFAVAALAIGGLIALAAVQPELAPLCIGGVKVVIAVFIGGQSAQNAAEKVAGKLANGKKLD